MKNLLHENINYIADVFETTKGDIKLPECTLATADIIFFFDDLFDSFNGRWKAKGHSRVNTVNKFCKHCKRNGHEIDRFFKNITILYIFPSLTSFSL